jgi:hypothetical protein
MLGKKATRHTWPVLPLTCGLTMALGLFSAAHGQSIDSYYLQPAQDGTNIIELDGSYQRFNAFQLSNGQKTPNTSLDQYSATVRYAHYIYIDGHPAGLQIFQSVDYFADWRFDGFNNDNASGMKKLQAANTTLSAFFWPYANRTNQTYVYTSVFLTPPDTGAPRHYEFAAASNGWDGDAQIGIQKGFGPNLSLEAAVDADFHSDIDVGDSTRRSIDPVYRLQVWANWDWGSGLRTSLGYTGVVGGAWTDTNDSYQYDVPRNAERQTLRVATSYWWTPKLQTSLELDHDVQADGGYQLGVGVLGRVKFLF